MEIIKVIILACQVSGGSQTFQFHQLAEYQRKCQVELSKCYDISKHNNDLKALLVCLQERGKIR